MAALGAPLRPRGRLAALAVACALGSACAPAAEETTASASGDDDTTTTGGTSLPPPQRASGDCLGAPVVDPGRIAGSLRGIPAVDRGICGVEGPTTYLSLAPALDVDITATVHTAGFTPRLGLSPSTCVVDRELACGGETIALRGVAAGTVLTLEIGAAADDPGLAAPEGIDDPLDFTVDVGFRRILAVGEGCIPESRGRCPGGTLCRPPLGADPEDLAAWVCDVLPADTCASAETIAIDGVSGEWVVARVDPQTDAHAHSCTGEGSVERVYRLEISAELPPGASLELASKATVGLAARGPGCELAAELACAAPVDGDGVALTIPDLEGLAQAGAAPLLFVEWAAAEDGEALEPVSLDWTIVGG
ncbi:MAG: hypothetical protein R3A79_25545 [Nannocystaceae bacterium]